MVDSYGTQTPLNQLGSINVPEARMLTVQVWDRSAVPAIEKAIRQSDLGLDPSQWTAGCCGCRSRRSRRTAARTW
ncbi:MAG: ribosome-recycling factor [Dehalococcoidia bacterium]|nr:ribosome-recycling factor [Dehalococcoidia bacterium]